MSFGTVFASAAFIVIFVMSFTMFTDVLGRNSDRLDTATSKFMEDKDAQLKTEISISNISYDGGSNLTVNVTNAGHNKVSDYDKMDLIITSYNATGGLNTVWVTYVAALSGTDDEWTVENITPDIINPGILDANETLSMNVSLTTAIQGGQTNWLQITTPNGVSTSSYFNS